MTSLFSIILIISAYAVPSNQTLRPEYFIVGMLFMLSLLNNRRTFFVLRDELKLITFLSIIALISILGELTTPDQFSERDFMILPRYGVYGAAMISGAYASAQSRNGKLLPITVNLLFFISIILSFVQYFNLFNWNLNIGPLYDEKYELLVSGAHWRRIYGTLGNPNYWGLLLGLGISKFGYQLLLQKRFISLPFLLLLLICIIMTGSRTSLIASFLGLLIGLKFLKTTSSKSLAQKFFGVFFGALVISLIFVSYEAFVSSFYADKNRFDISNTYTLELRLAYWQQFMLENLSQPYKLFIGRGPSKTSAVIFGDNMYLLIFRDFGLLALIIYLLFWKKMILRLFLASKSLSGDLKSRVDIGFISAITFAIFDMAADAWFNVRLAIPLLFGYGYLIMSVQYKEGSR